MYYAKLAKLALTAMKDNFVALDRPYKLNYAITYRCQSRCSTCSIWKAPLKGELTLDEIREFTKNNTSFQWMSITGGEPFLRSDLVEIVKAFLDNCKDFYILTIPTNSLCGADLIGRRVEGILDAGVPRLTITISLDGYRELHDSIRGVPGNFDRVMAVARRMRLIMRTRTNLEFAFGYTISKFNIGRLEQTYEAVKKEIPDITYNDFHVNVGQLSEAYYHNEKSADIRAERDEMANELNWLVSKRRLSLDVKHPMYPIESVFLKKLVDYVRTGKSPMRSRSLDASLFMDSYGNIYPSIMWNRKIGNVKECGFDLTNIWHNREAEEVRRLIREGKEPPSWTACEAYQAIVGNAVSLVEL